MIKVYSVFAFPDNFAVVLHVGVASVLITSTTASLFSASFSIRLDVAGDNEPLRERPNRQRRIHGDDARVVAVRITQHAHT